MTTPPDKIAALELICPAGNPAALEAAVAAGADVVYAGFADATNARNFPGLNFTRDEMAAGIDHAHRHGCGVYIAVNTYPEAGNAGPWRQAVDDAAAFGADAIILADIGLLQYAAETRPDLRRHLSVQASASNRAAIEFYQRAFGVKRVVLPRVLTLAEIAELNQSLPVETEVFAFGGMCVMAEGRCTLSAYATGQSPNCNGVCSPASHVRYERRGGDTVSRLGDFTLNIFSEGEAAGYPTLCKGRFVAGDSASYLFDEPSSLNVLEMLPELAAAGVRALKIEGRQRGRAYVSRVVSAFRQAVDGSAQSGALDDMTEGARNTAGAYQKSWH
ncbi:MAG: U32 family peptidase [Rhodospirillaceae bacterium]|nr:U32 family peptidase [Rhodospirillaceae bacterium]